MLIQTKAGFRNWKVLTQYRVSFRSDLQLFVVSAGECDKKSSSFNCSIIFSRKMKGLFQSFLQTTRNKRIYPVAKTLTPLFVLLYLDLNPQNKYRGHDFTRQRAVCGVFVVLGNHGRVRRHVVLFAPLITPTDVVSFI